MIQYIIVGVFLSAVLFSIYMLSNEVFTPSFKQIPNVVTIKQINCKIDADCNKVRYGPSSSYNNICKSDNTCHCVNGSGTFCQNGPTNYPDPMGMSEAQRMYFASKYHKNMTVQDYVNWLLLQGDGSALSIEHYKNFETIKRGGSLSVKDVPKFPIQNETWKTSADYFAALYKGQDLSIRNNDDGVYLASNYDDFSEFIPPKAALDRKIIGVAEVSMKQDARELIYYVRPDARSGEEETREGEEFRNKERLYNESKPIQNLPDPVI